LKQPESPVWNGSNLPQNWQIGQWFQYELQPIVTLNIEAKVFESARMADDQTYRMNAKEAELRAAATSSDVHKASWLKIAEGWMSLIRGRKPNAKETSFDAQEKARGASQTKSDSSH
jgi:hypothetical protein